MRIIQKSGVGIIVACFCMLSTVASGRDYYIPTEEAPIRTVKVVPRDSNPEISYPAIKMRDPILFGKARQEDPSQKSQQPPKVEVEVEEYSRHTMKPVVVQGRLRDPAVKFGAPEIDLKPVTRLESPDFGDEALEVLERERF